ncbi:hypothetical protein Tco_0952100 [Tanacetum coccineum]|uniref:Uncharacterized protein n=1 Tax=Tanacetum coccineum TaxID=301880 RepID=A0ABQ5DW20_9ASTR
MSKLLYTRFTKLIIDYLLSLNKSIPRKSNSKLHNSQDDHPITLLNTTNGDYKFGMEVPDAMISDAIKKKSGHPVYTDAHTTSVVHNQKENPELTSYISDKNAHHIPSPPAKKTPYHTTTPESSSLQAKAKKLMQKAKKNMRKFNFIKAERKFPYPTTTPQPNSLQAKAKKLMQKAKKIMRKINFKKAVVQKFREYDQKLEALINFNVSKAFEKAVQAKVLTEIKKRVPTHIPNAITNYVKPRLNTSMLEDPPNNREGEKKKKRQKDIGEPSSRSSRRAIRDIDVYNNDVELEYHVSQLKAVVLSEAQWNSDGGDVSKPRSFERHMSESTKPHPYLYNNDYTYLVDLNTEEKWIKEVRRYHFEALIGIHHWEENRIDFFKAGMSAVTKGNVFSNLRIKSVVRIDVKKKWGYGFLTSIVVRRSNDKEHEFSYADLPRLSVNDVEDMYLLQVQDMLHHLLLEFVKDFNNDLLMFIRRTVINNKVEDIQLGVESYQRTLNLTKPTMFFEGIDQRIPFTMTAMHKGVVYLNQYNIKSLMKLSEVKKFNDGTLVKIQENLIDMMSKNKLGSSNKRLKGRDWTDYDVKSSKEMLKKIDEILRHKEQLRRLEEYVGGRPKTVNPSTFVRPL